MPKFLIERNFAEQLEAPTQDFLAEANRVNEEIGVQWLFSFLSADKKKTYCLYEASSAEALREQAKRLNIPADAIIEVDGVLAPTGDVRSIDAITRLDA